jgi:predicted dehydrogenase
MIRDGKLGVGIIGCGGIAGTHIQALGALADRCRVVAVADPNEEAARRRMAESGALRQYADYRDLLADEQIDVVTIGTPHYLHAPIAIAAALAGKHVYVEKPMALTVGETQEMLAATQRGGVQMTVSSELANPAHRFVKERVLPEIGPVQFSFLLDYYPRGTAYYRSGAWRGRWATEGGGVFVNQAIYTWHPYTWLLGGVDTAYGYWANVLHPEIEVEDVGYALVRFRDGSHGKLFATTCFGPPAGVRRLEIAGERGTVWSDVPWLRTLDFALRDERQNAALHRDLTAALRVLDEPPCAPWALDDQTCRIRAQLGDFLAAIREGRAPAVTAASGAEPMKLLDGIYRHGARHAAAFRAWALAQDDLPTPARPDAARTVEDAQAAGWQGGRFLQAMLDVVRSPEPWLDAPFPMPL